MSSTPTREHADGILLSHFLGPIGVAEFAAGIGGPLAATTRAYGAHPLPTAENYRELQTIARSGRLLQPLELSATLENQKASPHR